MSGVLAIGGGFLLPPAYMSLLRLPTREAIGTALAAAGILAVPGGVVHYWLGHVDLTRSAWLACGVIPASYLGARVDLWLRARWLERLYAVALIVVAIWFFAQPG